MNPDITNIRDLKKMRLDRHWSQEQLAEMSGLSIRTIQRVERGEKAGLETLKSLAAVFDTTISAADTEENPDELTEKEEAYIKYVQGFVGLIIAIAMILLVPFIYAIKDASNWGMFIMFLAPCLLGIGIYAHRYLGWFGGSWKQKLIDKKFNKTK